MRRREEREKREEAKKKGFHSEHIMWVLCLKLWVAAPTIFHVVSVGSHYKIKASSSPFFPKSLSSQSIYTYFYPHFSSFCTMYPQVSSDMKWYVIWNVDLQGLKNMFKRYLIFQNCAFLYVNFLFFYISGNFASAAVQYSLSFHIRWNLVMHPQFWHFLCFRLLYWHSPPPQFVLFLSFGLINCG